MFSVCLTITACSGRQEPPAAAICELLDNPEQARQLAANAAREYAEHYSRQRICDKYIELFQHVYANR